MHYLFSSTIPERRPLIRPAAARAETPAISIVGPAFKEACFIANTLRSVIKATYGYKGPVEIIVVDNNSSDATGAIARSFGVRVIRDAFHRVGGFDETLYAAEEFSLARRLKAEGPMWLLVSRALMR